MAAAISLNDYFRVLRTNANYRRLWLAQLVSEMGDWLYSLAIYSLILERTGAASSVGIAIALQLLPQFFLGPLAGAVNDRFSRYRVMIFCDLARCATVASMLLAARSGSLLFMYALLFLETSLVSFFEPARTAVIPNLFQSERETLIANGLSSLTFSISLATGAAVGGYLGALLGRDRLFLLNAATFIVSAILIQGMRFVEPHLEDLPPLNWDLLQPVREGWAYIRRDSQLTNTLLLKLGSGMLAIHWILLPVFGERVFPLRSASSEGGLLSMSLLMAARGVGALIGPLLANRYSGGDHVRMRATLQWTFAVIGLGYFSLGLAPNLWLACGSVLLLQGGSATVWVLSTTLLQARTEDRFRGRVFAADLALIVGAMSLMSFIVGLLLDAGVTPRQVACGNALMALLPVLWWRRVRQRWPAEASPSRG